MQKKYDFLNKQKTCCFFYAFYIVKIFLLLNLVHAIFKCCYEACNGIFALCLSLVLIIQSNDGMIETMLDKHQTLLLLSDFYGNLLDQVEKFIDSIATINATDIATIASMVNSKLPILAISINGIDDDNNIVGIDSNIENLAASNLEVL